jgi:hypothetical protein
LDDEELQRVDTLLMPKRVVTAFVGVPIWIADGGALELPGWVGIVIGVAILALVLSDRGGIRAAWRNPARWWSREPGEYWRSRAPSQPLNVVLGLVLGTAAVVYGVLWLVS